MQYKDLFWQLTIREIKARYKQSILGFAWAILVPLLHLTILSIVFSNLFKVPTDGIPYPVFLFTALVPWIFFVNAITSATGSILANSSLITKIKLPREILPLSAISAKMVDLILTYFILLFFLFLFGIGLKATALFIIPVFFVQLLLIVGVSLFLSATNVFFRDVENILGVFLTMWMYMTPVIYSPQMIPENLRILFYLNPMTPIINAYRDILLYGKVPGLDFVYALAASLVILTGGLIYFQNRSKLFADVI